MSDKTKIEWTDAKKERGIPMRAENVLAIQAGRKIETQAMTGYQFRKEVSPVDPHWRYRNRKILAHASGQPCQNCGADDRTVVAAHSNQQEHGRGMRLKSHDMYVAFLCNACHYWYDYGCGLSPCHLYRADRGQKKDMFDRAMQRTWFILVRDGVLS